MNDSPVMQSPSASRLPLYGILLFSLVLNIWGNEWGAPDNWHPDEITLTAVRMSTQRSLDPQAYQYGALQYYVVMAGAVLPVAAHAMIWDPQPDDRDTPQHRAWRQRVDRRLIPLARWISAIQATLTVLVTYLLCSHIVDRRAGLLAALFLATNMGFVVVAHFATVDAGANLWFWTACLLVWAARNNDNKWLWVLAALAGGFAVGTKIDRALIVIPLIGVFMAGGLAGRIRSLLLCGVLFVAAFIAANPTIALSPFGYADGFLRDAYFNVERDNINTFRLFDHLLLTLGIPGAIAAALAIPYAAIKSFDVRWRSLQGVVGFVLIPYLLLFGFKLSSPWYMPLLYPAVMICLAFACSRLLQKSRTLGTSLAIVLLGCSLIYTGDMLGQFSSDARIRASAWINDNVPAGSSILRPKRSPVIDEEKYTVVKGHADRIPIFIEWRDKMDSNPTYLAWRKRILDTEAWTGRALGWSVREAPYTTWFDRLEPASTGPPAITADYVVTVGYIHQEYIARLSAPESGYVLARTFEGAPAGPFRPHFDFVNSVVRLYMRDDLDTRSHPTSQPPE